ncbi:PilN domain-containing protein [Novilysobacter selenitireducens]|uniref:PilN domain-containing protein n=1 Tax=Novilysobacter selenitireducens TaxID=2872639 RepID=A0ABS7T9J9_9GAMM|nr:PilN domain-containing protein [Lysobacter selenitireducens]MBZ4040516.1 PilN domain-containing protein [Lysobacter selenitireducens]
MARINLLPWRAERRKQRQQDFIKMVGVSVIAAIALAFLIISYHNGQIDGQKERNAYLEQQITEVDAAITEIEKLDEQKARLLARKEVIEELQANRSQMVHLFDSLVRTIPDGVVLTAIKQDSQTLTLDGRAQSNARVSTYLRNLEGSGWMSNPDLSIIEAAGDDKALPYQFTLSVKLANPNAPVDADGDGIPDDPQPVEAAADPLAEPNAAPVDGTAAPAPAAEAETQATPEDTDTGAAS